MQPPHIVVADWHNLLAYVCTTCAMPYNTTACAWWGAFCVRHLQGHCDDIRTVFWMASPSRRTAGTRYLPARRAAMGFHRVAYLAPRQCTDRRFVRAGQLPIWSADAAGVCRWEQLCQWPPMLSTNFSASRHWECWPLTVCLEQLHVTGLIRIAHDHWQDQRGRYHHYLTCASSLHQAAPGAA